jgi:arylsulfatase A-like enzyme
VIVVDTLRADHLSPYGSSLSTPNVARLAARGQVFTNVTASFHQTSMSMGALFTGVTPSIESDRREKPLEWTGRTWCGMARFSTAADREGCLPAGLDTLGAAMTRAGYHTVGVVSNPFLFRPAGFDRGCSSH